MLVSTLQEWDRHTDFLKFIWEHSSSSREYIPGICDGKCWISRNPSCEHMYQTLRCGGTTVSNRDEVSVFHENGQGIKRHRRAKRDHSERRGGLS